MAGRILEWNDLYCLGDKKIDAQHQYLFELANIVLDSSEINILASSVMNLFQYVRKHFHDEEEFMQSKQYANLDEHCNLHEDLISRLSSLPSPTEKNQLQLKKELHHLMYFWVLKHIIDEDSRILQVLDSTGSLGK